MKSSNHEMELYHSQLRLKIYRFLNMVTLYLKYFMVVPYTSTVHGAALEIFCANMEFSP